MPMPVGTTHIDALAAFSDDPDTDAIVMIGVAAPSVNPQKLTTPAQSPEPADPGSVSASFPTLVTRVRDADVRDRPHRPVVDGLLEFSHWRDTQVRLKRNRIELGEIEAVATATDRVRRAVAVLGDAGGEQSLDLFVEVVGDVRGVEEAIRESWCCSGSLFSPYCP